MNISHTLPSRWLQLAIAFSLAASLTACGGGGGESSSVDSTTPGSTTTPGTTPAPGSAGLQDATLVSRQGEGGNAAAIVAIDAAGNSIAVWIKEEGFSAPEKKELLARRYVAGSGWQAVEVLTSDATTVDFSSPAITMDPTTGKAMVAWVNSTVNTTNGRRNSAVLARAYDPASGWAASAIVKQFALNYSAGLPVLGTDPNGNVIAVWSADDLPSSNLYANRYTPGGGWGTATLLTPEGGGAFQPSLAFTSNGNGLVLFRRPVSNQATIWGIQYSIGSGWGTSAMVVNVNSGQEPSRSISSGTSIASDANGNAIAVWVQNVSVPGASSASGFFQQGVWAKRYTGGAWSADSTLVAPPVGCNNCPFAYNPIVKMNPQGLAAVTWITGITDAELDASSKVRVSRLRADGTWEALLANASQAVSGFVDEYSLPDVGIDAQGNIRSVWGYKSIVNNLNDDSIYTNLYVPGTGWGSVDLIENHPQSTNTPRIAVNARGNAMTVWQQFDDQLGSVVAGRNYKPGR